MSTVNIATEVTISQSLNTNRSLQVWPGSRLHSTAYSVSWSHNYKDILQYIHNSIWCFMNSAMGTALENRDNVLFCFGFFLIVKVPCETMDNSFLERDICSLFSI